DADVNRAVVDLMFDPQTSGGLLISLNKKDTGACLGKMKANGQSAWIIGEITHDSDTGFLNII
ncbi:MAG: selenide, water dikinase SelD, partial [Desulfobacterales bacterium]|nr:selenide, water dikinase SelD [Desulfobacterales bacterium]